LGDYSGNSIEVLQGLEAVRKRPGMYIGGTSETGLFHLLTEIFDNSCDEALNAFCDYIVITKEEDGFISVLDNGRGIPVDINNKTGRSALELVFTELHAGGKFNNDKESSAFAVSGGLHGVGASVTNALSERTEVYVKRVHMSVLSLTRRSLSMSSLSLIQTRLSVELEKLHF